MPRVPAQQRRESLIQAAINVIAEYGVNGATTRRIAAAARAPLASLHYAFHSKEELFFAIQEEQVRLLDERDLQVSPEVGLGATAAEILRLVMEWWTDQTDFARATIELMIWAHRHDRSLAIRSYDVGLTSIIKDLREAKTADDGDELIEALARMIAAAADGLALQWLTYRDRDRLAKDVELFGESMERLVAEHRGSNGTNNQTRSVEARGSTARVRE